MSTLDPVSALENLRNEVGSTLGYRQDLDGGTAPRADDVDRWLLSGQRDLCSRLVPDALRSVWLITTSPGGIAQPGHRIISVTDSTGPVRQITNEEVIYEAEDGLFSRSTWRWGNSSGNVTMILSSGESSDLEIIYIPVGAYIQSVIRLDESLHPLLIRYALIQNAIAEEEDQQAALLQADYTRAIAETNALWGGSAGALTAPGSRDADGVG